MDVYDATGFPVTFISLIKVTRPFWGGFISLTKGAGPIWVRLISCISWVRPKKGAPHIIDKKRKLISIRRVLYHI